MNPSNSQDTVLVAQPVAHLDFNQSGTVSVSDFRGFAGLQINLLAVALYVQANADTSKNLGANAGLRIFW